VTEVLELRKDAARYRWLRDRIKKQYGLWFIDARLGMEGPTETDAAIDAAMKCERCGW
jgi:hypothetical protein